MVVRFPYFYLGILAIISCEFGAVAMASPRVIFVDRNASGTNDGSSWTDAFTHFEDALAVATPDNGPPDFDQIWVAAAGTNGYSPGTNASDTFLIPSGVEVYGGFAPGATSLTDANTTTHPTLLNGDFGGAFNCDVVVTFVDVSNATHMKGFTVINGALHAIVIHKTGYVDTSIPTLDLIDITDNGDASTSFGGGIAVTGGASPVISQCAIHGNYARFGGGIAIDSDSRASITRCTINGNTAGHLFVGHVAGGGGIYSDANTTGHGPTVVRSCFIHDNFVTFGDGGGIMTTSVLRVLDVLLEKNVVSGDNSLGGGNGAGLAAVPANTNSPAPMVTLHNVDFYRNACQSPALDSQAIRSGGGGAFVLKGRLVAVNCLFRGNEISNSSTNAVGGALLCDNALSTTLTNITVEGNRAYTNSGVFVQDGNTNSHQVSNSIFWDNKPFVPPTQLAEANLVEVNSNTVTYQLAVDYCDIGDDTAGDAIVPFGGAVHHNIDLDPLFVGGGNHRLQTASPCIDAANSTLLPQDNEDLNRDGISSCNGCNGNPGERVPDLDLRRRVRYGFATDTGVSDDVCNVGCGCMVDMGAFEYSLMRCVVMGDMNSDGLVDGNDIQPFEDCYFGGTANCECGDFDFNGSVDAGDVSCFIDKLLYRVSVCESECSWTDCNTNGTPDQFDLLHLESMDCNTNQTLDECEHDCNTNGWADECDIVAQTSTDEDANGTPDECDDCNTNGTLDSVDIANNPALDANSNGIPDECDEMNLLSGGGESMNMSQSSEPRERFRLTPEFMAAMDALLTWFAENPRESYPHLSDGAYADLVLEQTECLGLYSP